MIGSSAAGIEAMQMINRKVFRSCFLILLLGLVPVSLAFAGYAYVYWSAPASPTIIGGAAIYMISVFLVTLAGNVPMNNRLERMDPFAQETADYWKVYGVVWTRWNHVRTLGSVASAVCFLIAAIALA
jgi:uncharacterized membrane protein